MTYAAYDMNIGIDGLESESEFFRSDDADECYRELVSAMEKGHVFIGRVLELDDQGKKVWTEGTKEKPYPHLVEPEWPDFYLAYYRQAA